MMRVKEILATVPAIGWFAQMGDEKSSHIPVENWVFARYEYQDGDGWEESTGWLGVGVWTDGPDFMESFSDFQGYNRWGR